MLRSRLIGAVAATAATLTVGGALAGPAFASAGGQRLPAHIFAPYFQAYQSGVSPAALSDASGAKYLTMAFLQTATTGSCDILWNGDPTTPVTQSTFGADIAKIRARGGDVVPSFGGFSADDTATEIADSCTDVNKIAAAYEKVVATYNVNRLDMDIEDNSLTNVAGIERRSRAINLLQQWGKRHGRNVQIVYTIPTNVSGIDDTGFAVLQSAVKYHVDLDVVNIMTFDYYDYDPVTHPQAHNMAADTKTAANALIVSLHQIYPHTPTARLWRMVGITEMVGNDDYGSGGEPGPLETFTVANARTVASWAQSLHIAELSFWALARDRTSDGTPDCVLGTVGGDTCSGVKQSAWQFSHIFEQFTSAH
jgi:Glycosyl hydrolases family 18